MTLAGEPSRAHLMCPFEYSLTGRRPGVPVPRSVGHDESQCYSYLILNALADFVRSGAAERKFAISKIQSLRILRWLAGDNV